jgi:hypothetical protein
MEGIKETKGSNLVDELARKGAESTKFFIKTHRKDLRDGRD